MERRTDGGVWLGQVVYLIRLARAWSTIEDLLECQLDAFLLFVLATTEDAELAVTSAFILSRSETKAPFVFVEVVAMATACSVPLTLRAVSAED